MIEIPSSKEEKNLFLQIPHHPVKWDSEEFKMGASPPLSSPPSLPSGGQGEGGKGEGGKGEGGKGRELKLSQKCCW